MKIGQSSSIRLQLVALPLLAWGLERLVESAAPQMTVAGSASTVAECLPELARTQPDVVLLDLDSEHGTDSLAALHSQTEARVLVITASLDETLQDSAVLAGARGVVSKRELPSTLLKAIEKVHEGEIWIDHDATSRIFRELAREKSSHSQDPAQHKITSLTPRERQTVVALVSDASAPGKVVAERLNISEHTLRNHLTSIYSKLGLSNRVDLYAFAHKHDLSNRF